MTLLATLAMTRLPAEPGSAMPPHANASRPVTGWWHEGGDIGTYQNGTSLHTTQLLFPDDVCQAYAVLEPYVEHQLAQTPLTQDQVYNEALTAGEDPTSMVPTLTPINS